MELHHKLRRDPNWDPNSCNICGQVLVQCSPVIVADKVAETRAIGKDFFVPLQLIAYDAVAFLAMTRL
jgi:hypothetical protein